MLILTHNVNVVVRWQCRYISKCDCSLGGSADVPTFDVSLGYCTVQVYLNTSSPDGSPGGSSGLPLSDCSQSDLHNISDFTISLIAHC